MRQRSTPERGRLGSTQSPPRRPLSGALLGTCERRLRRWGEGKRRGKRQALCRESMRLASAEEHAIDVVTSNVW